MLPKPHLTSHFRMSVSRWVTTPLWLSGSLRPFLNSSVYSFHLFNLFYFCWILTVLVPILAWNVHLISPVFLKRSLVFPILLFSSISLHCSFKKAFSSLSLLLPGTLHSVRFISRFLPCLLFFFFPQLFVKPPQTTTLLLGFLFLWDGFDHCLLYNVMNFCP